jgi:predicted dehydrogenase
MLNVALIGYGYAGQTFHAPLIAATPGLELAAIVSSNAEKVRGHWPDVTVLPTPEQAFDAAYIDLIVIATPNDTHADLARRALAAGKHVVVDKPFTVDLADAKRLAAQAKHCSRILSVFHNRRWDGDFLTLKRLINAGELGRVTQFESHFDRFRPAVRDRWREKPGPGAGLWYDLGPHVIDQALCLFGAPQSIYADIGTQRSGDGAPDYFHALLRYADGLRVILHGSMLTPASGLRFAVHGNKASFISHGLDSQEDALKAGQQPGGDGWGAACQPPSITSVAEDGSLSTRVISDAVAGDYLRYFAELRDAILSATYKPVTPEEAIQVMEIIEMGQQASDQKREIHLN